MSRLAERSGRWIAVLAIGAMLIPATMWLVDEVRFRLSADAVVETLAGELSGSELADAVLLVQTVGCDGTSRTSGSAFVLDGPSRPLLVTNRHVVEGTRRVGVRSLQGGTPVRVTGARTSTIADVAVLEVEDPEQVPPALIPRDQAPGPGASVHLVGFPAAMPFTTEGTIAQASRNRLLLDLDVDPGASGSPVVDEEGEVVGQIFGVTQAGLGVATPVDLVLEAVRPANTDRKTECPR